MRLWMLARVRTLPVSAVRVLSVARFAFYFQLTQWLNICLNFLLFRYSSSFSIAVLRVWMFRLSAASIRRCTCSPRVLAKARFVTLRQSLSVWYESVPNKFFIDVALNSLLSPCDSYCSYRNPLNMSRPMSWSTLPRARPTLMPSRRRMRSSVSPRQTDKLVCVYTEWT